MCVLKTTYMWKYLHTYCKQSSVVKPTHVWNLENTCVHFQICIVVLKTVTDIKICIN